MVKAEEIGSCRHTSHPQLCRVLRYSNKWEQISAKLYGGKASKTKVNKKNTVGNYGGHFRAIQGFKYIGESL